MRGNILYKIMLGVILFFIVGMMLQMDVVKALGVNQNTKESVVIKGEKLNITQNENSFVHIQLTYIPEITKLEIYRSTSLTGTYVKLYSDDYLMDYNDTTITFGQTYYYKAIYQGIDTIIESEVTPITTKGPQAPVVTANSWYYGNNLSWPVQQHVESYEIYRSNNATTGFTLLTNTKITSFMDSSCQANRMYYYKVRAKVRFQNQTYYSAFSTLVYINMHLDAPQLKATSKSSGIQVTWSSVDAATTYHIYRSTKPTNYYKRIAQVSSYAKEYVDVGNSTAPNTTYYYRIIAENSENHMMGSVSNTVSGKIAVSNPKNVALKAASAINANQVKLTWYTSSGATGYQIYRSTSSKTGFQKIATTSKVTTYVDTSKTLLPKHTYYYKVRPIKKYYQWYLYGGYSGYKRVKTNIPATSISVISTPGKGKVVIYWKKVNNTKYRIYCSSSPYGSYRLVKTITNGATSCKFTGLKTKKTYYYKIKTMVIPSNKKTYYGNYSNRRSIKVRASHTKYDVIDTARAQLKKRYRWGGTGPNSFDCSGLIYYAYRQNGYRIPRAVGYAGRNLGKSCTNVKAGDILTYTTHYALVTKVVRDTYNKNIYYIQVIEAMNVKDGIKENIYVFTKQGPMYTRLKYLGFRRI